MAYAEEAIIKRLNDDGAVSAITTNIGVEPAPQSWDKSSEYIVMSRIDGEREHEMTGASGNARLRIQIDYYAPTRKRAEDLADAARKSLDGFKGSITPTMGDSIEFEQLHLISDNTDYVEQSGSDNQLQRISHDYEAWIVEATS